MLSNINTVKNIFEEHSLTPRKSLGQNFLIDENILCKIIELSELSKTDTVIEVGSGIGTLTAKLSKKVKKVITIEKDKKLIPILRNNLINNKNITIIDKDVLKFSHQEKNYKVIANIPYYITSPIIRQFLEDKNPPSLIVIMIQKEVAGRIIAKPPKMNLLAASVQVYGKPEVVKSVSRNCFWPQPDVDSAILKITPYRKKETASFYSTFFSIVKAGFSHPRKQLIKNFQLYYKKETGLIVKSAEYANINLERRAETLSIEEWKKITKTMMKESLHL